MSSLCNDLSLCWAKYEASPSDVVVDGKQLGIEQFCEYTNKHTKKGDRERERRVHRIFPKSGGNMATLFLPRSLLKPVTPLSLLFTMNSIQILMRQLKIFEFFFNS